MLWLIRDAAHHVKAFCAQLGMTVEHKAAALSARIAVLVVDPDAEVMRLHGVKQCRKLTQIFLRGGKAARKRDIGDGTAVAVIVVGIHVCVVIRHPMMGHREHAVAKRGGLERFQIGHGEIPFYHYLIGVFSLCSV